MGDSLIFVFDRVGKLVKKTLYPMFDDARSPFYARNLEGEASTQLLLIDFGILATTIMKNGGSAQCSYKGK